MSGEVKVMLLDVEGQELGAMEFDLPDALGDGSEDAAATILADRHLPRMVDTTLRAFLDAMRAGGSSEQVALAAVDSARVEADLGGEEPAAWSLRL